MNEEREETEERRWVMMKEQEDRHMAEGAVKYGREERICEELEKRGKT